MKALKDVCKISKDGEKIISNIKGAVFLTRSTYSEEIFIHAGKDGLRKEHGCVTFLNGKTGCYVTKHPLSKAGCIKIYNDSCPTSSAWLVIPVGKDWHWYPVTAEIKFS